MTLPDGLDPAEFVAAYGPDAFKTVLDEAIPLIKFGIDRRLRGMTFRRLRAISCHQ